MSGSRSSGPLNNLSTLFRFGTLAALSDAQLLEQFVDGRDEGSELAFRTLVERHGSMVLNVCQCVLGNRHDAEDAFQVTFLVLARKAGSIRKRRSLGCWLHGVAHHVALRTQSATRRRIAREKKVAKGAEKDAFWRQPGDDGGDLSAALHQEITRLPEKYRAPIALCYLEGMTHDQAAHELSWPVGTVRGRLARARRLLETRLNRRRPDFSASLFAMAASSDGGMRALATSLVNKTVRAALSSSTTEIVPRSLSLWFTPVLGNVFLFRQAWIAAASLMVIALATGSAAVLSYAHPGRARSQALVKDVRWVPPPAGLEHEKPNEWPVPAVVMRATSELVEQLRLHPARPSAAADRLALHLIDLETGAVTLIADEPDRGLVRCGSPEWSHDGTRIIYDAMPMNDPPSSRLKVIELAEGKLKFTELGPGNCPSFCPTDDHIVYLNNSTLEGAQVGLCEMHADGTHRRFLGDYGRPRWSPDNRQFLIVDFAKPRGLMLNDISPPMKRPLKIDGYHVFWEPNWAGNETIIAAIGGDTPDAIAFIDVNEQNYARVKEILWRRGDGPDVQPFYPLYSAATRRCVFVGLGPEGKSLYAFRHGLPDPPRRLEFEGHDNLLQDLAISPDGRYVLFTSDRRTAGDGDVVQGDSLPES